MSNQEQKITRDELYQLVWTRTFVKLAKELGYTYTELVAICEDSNIPRPASGYWDRLQRGQAEGRSPLPPPPAGKLTEISYGPRRQNANDDQHQSDVKPKSDLNPKETDVRNGNTPNAESEQEAIGEKPQQSTSEKSPITPIKSSLEPIEYSREQLYDAIWSKPCIKLAAELGISDVGLAKTCRRLGIPRPPRGYWARIEAGEKLKRTPLPAAQPGQNTSIVFDVRQNIERRQELSANLIASPIHDSRCAKVSLPPEGADLNEVADRHRKAMEKAKPDERGIVRCSGRNYFSCAVSSLLIERTVRAIHALVCELEDRDYDFKASANEYGGLNIIRDQDEVSVRLSEEILELEREPTAAEKRKPSWTWQLKETKPSGNLSVSVEARGIKGKRQWAEGDGRTIEEVLGVVVEKIEAVFRGHEERRKREAEWQRQREEEQKRYAEQAAQEERVRKKREATQRHRQKLEAIVKHRGGNLDIAADDWLEMQGKLAFIQACEKSWRSVQNGELTNEQVKWLAWARGEAEKLNPLAKGYPDPSSDGGFDAENVPEGGPYPETRKLESKIPKEQSQTEKPEIKPPVYHSPPPEFQYWLMHRRR